MLAHSQLFVSINLLLIISSILIECSNVFGMKENIEKLKDIVPFSYNLSFALFLLSHSVAMWKTRPTARFVWRR